MKQKVVVVGLGKIGLPLALHIASGPNAVTGVDINEELVAQVNSGLVPKGFNEPGISQKLTEAFQKEVFSATTDLAAAVSNANVVVVVVPLKLDEELNPDFQALDNVTSALAKFANPETLFIFETTVPIGTTRNRFLPILSAGLKVEKEKVNLVFSPERVFVGSFFETMSSVPKLVGGISDSSANLAADFYNSFIEFHEKMIGRKMNGVWKLGSPEEAEFAKLAETTYRDVNIGLANTFASHAYELDLDIARIIEACNSQPFSNIHKPGIFVGGHCIPVYPMLYCSTDADADIVKVARKKNLTMPEEMISKLISRYKPIEKAKVLILGISYRGNVKESYMSGVFPIVDILTNLSCDIRTMDSYYDTNEMKNLGLSAVTDDFDPEIIILQSDHKEFLKLSKDDFPSVQVLLDGRSFLDEKRWPEVDFISFGSKSDSYSPKS